MLSAQPWTVLRSGSRPGARRAGRPGAAPPVRLAPAPDLEPELDPAPPPALAAALAEPESIIVLVVGAGADSDRAELTCRGLALDPGFEAVRVVRLRHQAELTRTQRASWLPGGRPLAILGPDRRVALPLARPDAIDLFVAVAALA